MVACGSWRCWGVGGRYSALKGERCSKRDAREERIIVYWRERWPTEIAKFGCSRLWWMGWRARHTSRLMSIGEGRIWCCMPGYPPPDTPPALAARLYRSLSRPGPCHYIQARSATILLGPVASRSSHSHKMSVRPHNTPVHLIIACSWRHLSPHAHPPSIRFPPHTRLSLPHTLPPWASTSERLVLRPPVFHTVYKVVSLNEIEVIAILTRWMMNRVHRIDSGPRDTCFTNIVGLRD